MKSSLGLWRMKYSWPNLGGDLFHSDLFSPFQVRSWIPKFVTHLA